MKLEKFEWIKNNGLYVNNKKYGFGITKLEIDGTDIKIYISKKTALNFDEMIKNNNAEDFCNPYELKEYENVKIIEE